MTLQHDGQQSVSLFYPWDSPGKNTGVDCHFLPLGDLPDPGIEPASLASPVLAGRFFGTETPGKSLLFSQRWPICKDVFGQGTFISGYVLPTI